MSAKPIESQEFADKGLNQLQTNVRQLRDELNRAYFAKTYLLRIVKKDSADAGAATVTSAITQFIAPCPCELTSAKFVSSSAVAASAANYATIRILVSDGAGGSQTRAFEFATNTNAILAGEPVTFTGDSVALATGSLVLFEITKTGAGVIIPAGLLQVAIEVR